MHPRLASLAVPALLCTVLTPVFAEDAAYRTEVERWRTQREERLKADGGWLTGGGLAPGGGGVVAARRRERVRKRARQRRRAARERPGAGRRVRAAAGQGHGAQAVGGAPL